MIRILCFVVIILNLLRPSQSLQSGYTCETSVNLSCPSATKLVILEVTYSSECPSTTEDIGGGAIYAPSSCLGYARERVSNLCNGRQTCNVDHSLGQRPMFTVGKQANCAFKGQSVNIEYSCVYEFYSSKLPRIDICSLQSLHGVREGFIHTPNYPNGYPNNQACSKTVPSPDPGHRLKIFALNFDVEGLSVLRWLGIKRINDWFQINNSGEKMFGIRAPYTLLFDDIIEASLMFKSDFANTKRSYNGFLLYFIVTPIRGFRASTMSSTTSKTSTTNSTLLTFLANTQEGSTVSIDAKTGALISNDRTNNNVGLTLLVVLLSGILFVIACAFLLYKRRNDRRIRYLTDMFNSFFPSRTNNVTLNTTVQTKLDSSLITCNEKPLKNADYHDRLLQTPILKHVNINEKRQSLEKSIFIENLKTSPSHRRYETKFNAKEQIDGNGNIYSEDPLSSEKVNNNNNDDSSHYACIDLNETSKREGDEVIYDVINTNNERSTTEENQCDDSTMYAVPKNDV